MTPGDFREQRKVRRRFEPGRRNRHETGERQWRTTDSSHHLADVIDGTAALLFLLADVHLDIYGGVELLAVRFLDQRGEQRCPVERMDRLEQTDGLGGLVGLKPADRMQADVGISRDQ